MILTPTLLTLSATAGDYGIGAAIAGIGGGLFGLNRRPTMSLSSEQFGDRMDAITIGCKAVSAALNLIRWLKTATSGITVETFVADIDDVEELMLSSSIKEFNSNIQSLTKIWQDEIELREDATEADIIKVTETVSAKLLQSWAEVHGVTLTLAEVKANMAKASAENKPATDKEESVAEVTPEVTAEEVVAGIKSTAAAVEEKELPSITEVLDNAVKKSHEDFDNSNIVIL